MYKIDEIKMLRLGQRDENLARPLTFDCSDWLEQYPEASIHILFRRPGESAIVPMSTTLEGTTLTWLIHDFEVGKTGVGNAEFRAVDTAGLRRKSRIIPCSIEETLLGDDETVLYTQDQVDETLAHISEAAQAAQAAKASEEAAALSAQEAGESAASAGTAADVAVGARDAAQAAQNAAETAQHQAEAAQSGVHADAVAAEQAKVAAQAAQASAQGAASQASADRTAAETARSDAEAAATHAEAVVEGIDQAGADQVAAVNAAGQAQVTAVNQAGTTQVGNVNAAGTTQINAVQAKGTQVINSIPADYSALTNEVTGLKSALGNNIFQLGAFVPDNYVKTDGTFDAYSGWTRTGFVDVRKFAEINAKSTFQSVYNCFYSDASEASFISSFTVKTTDNIVTIPDNAKYAVFSGSSAGMANLSVKVTKTRVEKEIESVEQKVSTAESNSLSRYFILENDTYNAEYSDLYLQRLGAIHYIKLVGFEQYTKCRLRLIARNHSSFHYRFIVAGYNGTSWTDVFDTGSNFTVTENANGDTYVTAAIGTKSVEMYIDYSKFPNNFSWNESSSTGSYRYIFSQNVYGKADENDVIPDIYFTKNSNENFDIVYHYSDTENVMIKFSPIGVNNLFAPHYLYKRNATKNEPVFSGYTTWDTIGTDWVSPYQGIIENDPSVSSGITVGGNHGTNGSSGFPTAQRVSIVAYADGKETELNKIYGCSEVKIVVVANIAASNTINMETGAFTPAMRETIVWTVTKNNFELCVYLEALKNISIKGYTGLQMTPGANPAIYFNDGTGQKSITGTRIDSVSYPTFKGNRSVILNTADGDLRITYTNRQVGIGNLSHISSDNPVAYVSTNQKLYQHLVNTIPLDLQMGESACYSGGYTFMKSYECTGAKEAYFISYNGEKQYCVDFLESGSCYAKLPAELIGHQIEVVEKDDTITIDQIVSGNGIRVISTGIGSVCFKVK